MSCPCPSRLVHCTTLNRITSDKKRLQLLAAYLRRHSGDPKAVFRFEHRFLCRAFLVSYTIASLSHFILVSTNILTVKDRQRSLTSQVSLECLQLLVTLMWQSLYMSVQRLLGDRGQRNTRSSKLLITKTNRYLSTEECQMTVELAIAIG